MSWRNAGHGLVRHHGRMLGSLGCPLPRGARVLDFGCGSGAHVYEYRDEGYDAYGFEIAKTVSYRKPEDEAFFRFALTGQAANVPDFRVDTTSFKIPFEDASFDFVFSSETFEHVFDYDSAFAEIARVLKPGAPSIHTFPARYRLIEPHMNVPLGGVIKNAAWFWLWALLGVRNEFQRGTGVRATVEANLSFVRTGVNYLRSAEILRKAAGHFREADMVPHLWNLDNTGYGCTGAALLVSPVLRALYDKGGTVVLFLRR